MGATRKHIAAAGSAGNGQPHCCTFDEEERKAEPETGTFTSHFADWVSDYDSDSYSDAESISSIADMSPPPPATSSRPLSGNASTITAPPASDEIVELIPVHSSVHLQLELLRTAAHGASRLST